MCHVSVAFPKTLQYTDPGHVFYLNTIQIREVHLGCHPQEHYLWPLPFAVVLSTYKCRGKYHLNLFELSWSIWQACSSIQTTILFFFTTTCSKFTHSSMYLKDDLYCIWTCLRFLISARSDTIPCYTQGYHSQLPQEGSAAAQSNPRGCNTSGLTEEPANHGSDSSQA